MLTTWKLLKCAYLHYHCECCSPQNSPYIVWPTVARCGVARVSRLQAIVANPKPRTNTIPFRNVAYFPHTLTHSHTNTPKQTHTCHTTIEYRRKKTSWALDSMLPPETHTTEKMLGVLATCAMCFIHILNVNFGLATWDTCVGNTIILIKGWQL